MKIIPFLFCFTFGLTGFGQDHLLKNAMSGEHDFLSYAIHHKEKRLFHTDTINTSSHVYLQKNPGDSLYGYDFKITYPGTSIYYLNETFYFFNHEKKKYIIATDPGFFSGEELLLFRHRLTEEDLIGTNRLSIQNTKNEFIATRKYKDQEEFSNSYKIYYINKKDKQVSKIITNVDFQNTNQYNEFNYSQFNYAEKINLKEEITEYQNKYTLVSLDDQPIKRSASQNFEDGINFQGKLLGQEETRDLNSFSKEIIILDYWFIACYPCIKSIPFLNKLHSTFSKDEVMVLGVNVIDEKEEEIKKFIEYNKVKYPIFISRENPYNVSAFPTIVVLNREREIIYTSSGYNKQKEEELISAIEKELGK